jgi:hypothetical protein
VDRPRLFEAPANERPLKELTTFQLSRFLCYALAALP